MRIRILEVTHNRDPDPLGVASTVPVPVGFLDIFEAVHNLPLDHKVDLDSELDALLDGEAFGLDGGKVLRQVDHHIVPLLHHQGQGLHDHLPASDIKNKDEISRVVDPDPVGSGFFFLAPELFVPNQARMKELVNYFFFLIAGVFYFFLIISKKDSIIWVGS